MPDESRAATSSREERRDRGLGIAILAGGRSRRMGRDKAEVELRGETLLSRAIRVFDASDTRLFVLGPRNATWHDRITKRENDDGSAPQVIADSRDYEGPLVAVAHFVDRLRQLDPDGSVQRVMLAAVDMPLLGADVARTFEQLLLNNPRSGAVVPCVAGYAQSLAALYAVNTLEKAHELVESGENSMRALLDHSNALVLEEAQLEAAGISPSRFRGVNRSEDVAAILDDLERGHSER